MTRSKNVYNHKIGVGGYVFVKEKMIKNKEIEADEEPSRGIMWLKGRVNKDKEFTDDEIRSVGDKLKEADDKIKEGTLNLDDGTDAMTVVFGKKKGRLCKRSEKWSYIQEVTPMGANEVDETQSSVVVRDKDGRIQKKSNGLVTSEKHLKKSNIVALGTIYKSDGKQMLHNQALPNDCYKVSIDSSLVNAACIPNVENNRLKTVKDDVGGFFAWLKKQVVLDEERLEMVAVGRKMRVEEMYGGDEMMMLWRLRRGRSARGVEVRLTVEIVSIVPMCGDSLDDGVRRQRCTYKWCGYNLSGGFCLFCASRNENSSIDAPNPNSFNDPPNIFTYPPQPQYEPYSCELCGNEAHYGYDYLPWFPLENELRQQEQAANLTTYTPKRSRRFNSFCYDDDDDEESTIPLNETISQNPSFIAITPVLPIEDPKDSLIMKDEDLSTIPKKESDEVIKSSVKDLVPIPSESKDTFESNSDIDEIDAFLDIDTSIDIKDGYHDSEGDIIYLESFLTNDIVPSLPFEVFLDHDPRSLSDIDDLKNMFKVFDPEILEKFFSPTYVSLPFKDRHYLFFTYVIRNFLPYFTYPVDSPFLLSSGSEDTLFNLGISAFHFSLEPVASHRSEAFMCFNVYLNILNESPMEICSSTRFNPNITMIWGESS
uniref:DUF8039 domain-containing protein n=1 Tax=Tanacetum cinerariifolium TaxID=118510 RepID=A0A699GJ41_TANCI|nr:hypothetical protein [Tanacetum cinerariifolium]